jgi:crossover junction endodeoxyribonuclease RuvC
MTIVIGIDPGLTGAIAGLNADGTLRAVHDLPVIRSDSLAWINGGDLYSLICDLKQPGTACRVVIEQAQAMPKMSTTAMFHYGMGFGSILSIVQITGLRLEFVRPAVWKRALGLAGANKHKGAALDKARLLWPDAPLQLRKHDGRAEALLIAHHSLTKSVDLARNEPKAAT